LPPINKLSTISSTMIISFPGYEYQDNFMFLPSDGASGGIVLAARESFMQLTNPMLTNHTISASIVECKSSITWNVIGLYVP
jgi:hypothetical protein